MVPYSTLVLCIPCLGSSAIQSEAFAPSAPVVSSGIVGSNRRRGGIIGSDSSIGSSTAVFSSPTGDRPPPRRTLKKRKNKRRQRLDRNSQSARGGASTALGGNSSAGAQQTLPSGEGDTFEIRPVRRMDAIEAGLDYWMEDDDMEGERLRRIDERNRKSNEMSTEGAIPKEKLRAEIVAPYKQNWIGLFSVFVATLSIIATKFPELLQIPVIPIPDL